MHHPSIQTQALFAHHPPTPLYILPRGGAINTLLENAPFIDAASLNDDDLDRMVDDLIAGVESEEEEETADESFEVEGGDDNEGSEESSEEEDTTVDPSIDAPVKATAPKSTTASSSTVVQQPPTNKSSQPQSSNTNITYKPIPTNAYYRFLLRRGPKGHILACFTLLSVQWIYTYLPLLYNVTSSILRTLHIYDPSQLEVYERQRLLREREKKASIGSKLMKKFGSNHSKNDDKTKQRQSDQSATFKLQQLYKTISSSSSMDRWENVRYSYLSVGFRKRHGLGREYVTVRPKTFMGESVGSGEHLMMGEEEEETVVLEDDDDRLNNAESEQEDGMTPDKKKKRRKVTDWVVSSFANRHFTPSNPAAAAAAASSMSKLWKSVHQDAILSAAWTSRNAEKSIWKSSNNDSIIIHHHRTNHPKSNQSSISYNNNSIAASKMFASVMTRVGSNGRLLGAYPMDALPIDQCCDKRGVLELARRYGYGDWKDDTLCWEEEEEDEMEDGWGGGDLFNEDAEGWQNNSSSSRRNISKRKNQKTVINTVDGLDETRSRRRRRRKKKIE